MPDVALVKALGKGSWTTAYLGADGHVYLHTNANSDQGKHVLQEARRGAPAEAAKLLPDLRTLGAGGKPGWIVFHSPHYLPATGPVPNKVAAGWWKILQKSFLPVWEQWTRRNLDLQGRHQRASILARGEVRAGKEGIADDPRFLALRGALQALHDKAPNDYAFEFQLNNLAWTEDGSLILLDVLFPACLYELKVEHPMQKRRNPPGPAYKLFLGEGAFTKAYGRSPYRGVNVHGKNVEAGADGVELLTLRKPDFDTYKDSYDLGKIVVYLARDLLVSEGKLQAALYLPVIEPSRIDWTDPQAPELVYLTAPFLDAGHVRGPLNRELMAALHRDVTGRGHAADMGRRFSESVDRQAARLRRAKDAASDQLAAELEAEVPVLMQVFDAMEAVVTSSLPAALYYGGDLHRGNFAVNAQTKHLLLSDPLVYQVLAKDAIKYWQDSGLPNGAPPAGAQAPASAPAPAGRLTGLGKPREVLTDAQLALLLIGLYAGKTRRSAVEAICLRFPIDLPWPEQVQQVAPELLDALIKVSNKLIVGKNLVWSQGHWKLYGPEAVVYTAVAAVKAAEARKKPAAPLQFWSPPETDTISDQRLVLKVLIALGYPAMADSLERKWQANRPDTGVPWARLVAPLGKEIGNKVGEVVKELRRADLLECKARGFWRLSADDAKLKHLAEPFVTGTKASSGVNEILSLLGVGRAPAKSTSAQPDALSTAEWVFLLLQALGKRMSVALVDVLLPDSPAAHTVGWDALEKVLRKEDQQTVKQMLIELSQDKLIKGSLSKGFTPLVSIDKIRVWARAWATKERARGGPAKLRRLAELYKEGEAAADARKPPPVRLNTPLEVVAVVLGYSGAIVPGWQHLLTVAEQEPDALPSSLAEEFEDGSWKDLFLALERDGRISQPRDKWVILFNYRMWEEAMDEAAKAAHAKLAPNPARGGWRRSTLADRVSKAHIAWNGHGKSRSYFACDTLAEAKKIAGA
jgi:hypothetical protein